MILNPKSLWPASACVCLCHSDGGAVVRAASLPGPVGQGVSERRGAREEIAPVQHPAQSPVGER